MMNYREQVQRVLAMHHANSELGLAKSREQEDFVLYVGRVLTRNHIAFTWRLNADFDAEFRVNLGDLAHLRQIFDARQFQADDTHSWVLSSNLLDGVEVRFILETN
ncbi:hypothetical protein [Alysiella crassa]|uniref:Uncharacterized protein n=1 Tax=Alysiella crassa TaxID=153491 RepID=A0A376BUN5_9NEIS|nr:hypothetical protein [Alysiella crassa]UOP06178.1 hypothetical protein LVJ80_10120 [Alysiella crassa]SSY80650.1 Uncharacterised protein [Alysiella crassa]